MMVRAMNDHPRVPPKEARVLWLLFHHPELTDDQIAEAAGCSRTSLYRMPYFKKLRQVRRVLGAELLPANGLDEGYEPTERDSD